MGILATSLAIMAIILGLFIYLTSAPRESLTLREALDSVAQFEGFRDWNELVNRSSDTGNSVYIERMYEIGWYLYIQNN